MRRLLFLAALGLAGAGLYYESELRALARVPTGEPPRPRFELPPVIAEMDARAGGGGAAEEAPPELDTSYLWAAYDAGDYGSVRREIAVLEGLHPNWRPPEELVRLTDAAEVRAVVLPAHAAGEMAEIIAYYEAYLERFACADITIEALWAVSDAYAASDRPDEAFRVHGRILEECDAADLRLATLEKAIARQDRDRFAALLAIEEERAHDEAEAERLARIRRDGLGGPASTAPVRVTRFDRVLRAVGARRASAEDLRWLEEQTRRRGNSNAAMVIGYHHLDAGDPRGAVDWFRLSLDRRRNLKAAEGLHHAYGRLGDRAEQTRIVDSYPEIAGRVASGGGAGDPTMARAWRALESGDHEQALRLAEVAVSADPAERELARGYALLGTENAGAAAAAFDRAARIGGRALRENAEKGRALTLAAAGRPEEIDLAAFENESDRRDVEIAVIDARIRRAFDAGRANEALAMLEDRRRRRPDAPAFGMLEGWILFEAGELHKAAEFFRSAYVETRSTEARQALLTVEDVMYDRF